MKSGAQPILRKHLANGVVLVRVLMVFWIVGLLCAPEARTRFFGVGLLGLAALLDWADGYIAHKLGTVSLLGGLLDTLGDRITENVFFIFFAWQGVLPLYVPLFYVTRSLAADFIRSVSFRNGVGTFAVHTSAWGKWFVASRPSRVLYLVMKIAIFLAAALQLAFQCCPDGAGASFISSTKSLLPWACAAVVAFSALRFALLIYDSRAILKREFAL